MGTGCGMESKCTYMHCYPRMEVSEIDGQLNT